MLKAILAQALGMHKQPQDQPPIERFCDQTQLSYLASGEAGEAVVLLHGWGAFKELWWSTLQELGQNYRVVAPDLPGHGGSVLANALVMAHIAERIATFCQVQGFKHVALVGHSMGGNIAVELALARPDLVRRLVLVDAAIQGRKLPRYTRSYLVHNHGYAALRMTLLLSRYLRVVGDNVPHNHGGGALRPALRRLAYASRQDAAELHRLLASLITNSLEERAAAIRVPTLVVSGALDPLVPAPLSRRLAAIIPAAQFRIIRGAGHNPMDERPHAFNQIVHAFLTKTSAYN